VRDRDAVTCSIHGHHLVRALVDAALAALLVALSYAREVTPARKLP